MELNYRTHNQWWHRLGTLALLGALTVLLPACTGSNDDESGGRDDQQSKVVDEEVAGEVVPTGLIFPPDAVADVTLSAVAEQAGVAIPYDRDGAVVVVTKTGSPSAVAWDGEVFVAEEDAAFVSVEVALKAQISPWPSFDEGRAQSAETVLRFTIDDKPVAGSVDLPALGSAMTWTIAAGKDAAVALEVTNGPEVQVFDAHTGKVIQGRDSSEADVIRFSGQEQTESTRVITDDIHSPPGITLKLTFPSGLGYRAAYVNNVGWADAGKSWIMVDFAETVHGAASAESNSWWLLRDVEYEVPRVARFSVLDSDGAAVSLFGGEVSGDAQQLLWQADSGATEFQIAVDVPLDFPQVSERYQYDPARIDFEHIYSIAFD